MTINRRNFIRRGSLFVAAGLLMPEEMVKPAKKYWFGHKFTNTGVASLPPYVFFIDYDYHIPKVPNDMPQIDLVMRGLPSDEFVKKFPDWRTFPIKGGLYDSGKIPLVIPPAFRKRNNG